MAFPYKPLIPERLARCYVCRLLIAPGALVCQSMSNRRYRHERCVPKNPEKLNDGNLSEDEIRGKRHAEADRGKRRIIRKGEFPGHHV